MKSTFFTSLLTAALVAASPAFADHFNDDPDMQSSILNDLDKPGYVGTGLRMGRERIDPWDGSLSGNPDLDQSGFVKGTAGPEKGDGDQYGSVLYDVGVFR